MKLAKPTHFFGSISDQLCSDIHIICDSGNTVKISTKSTAGAKYNAPISLLFVVWYIKAQSRISAGPNQPEGRTQLHSNPALQKSAPSFPSPVVSLYGERQAFAFGRRWREAPGEGVCPIDRPHPLTPTLSPW